MSHRSKWTNTQKWVSESKIWFLLKSIFQTTNNSLKQPQTASNSLKKPPTARSQKSQKVGKSFGKDVLHPEQLQEPLLPDPPGGLWPQHSGLGFRRRNDPKDPRDGKRDWKVISHPVILCHQDPACLAPAQNFFIISCVLSDGSGKQPIPGSKRFPKKNVLPTWISQQQTFLVSTTWRKNAPESVFQRRHIHQGDWEKKHPIFSDRFPNPWDETDKYHG